jgi:hypothetical protein
MKLGSPDVVSPVSFRGTIAASPSLAPASWTTPSLGTSSLLLLAVTATPIPRLSLEPRRAGHGLPSGSIIKP